MPTALPDSVHTASGSPTWDDEQIPPIESLKVRKFDSPYVILAYNASAARIDFSPMNQPTTDMPKTNNVIDILGRLKNASEFLKHFQTMQRAGYALYNGTENMLIFQKKQPEQATTPPTSRRPTTAEPVIEAAAPKTTTGNLTAQPDKQAAAVLDETSTQIDLPPTAPPAASANPFIEQPKVRRQEKVFSGTVRTNAVSSESATQKPCISEFGRDTPATTSESLWRRFTRGIRRTVLTIAALGVGAYTIGFVAEGLGARAQQQKGIENGETPGPRKRIVMSGQRPGIYSTESSR